ncbi:MAG: glycoside hydrolase family 3 N-terminal domain-containing protein [Spirulinaceae cyanobacterium]
MVPSPKKLPSTLPSWTLRQQIAQMIVVRTSGHYFEGQIRYPQWEANAAQLQHWLGDLNVGGVILLGGTAAEVRLRTAQLQAWAQTPLLIAADIEEGVGQRFEGATWFPPPLALAAIADREQATHLARQMGQVTAQEAAALGINWILAPVVDVNNNPSNPVINVRAFGETPEQVSQLATAFIQGAQVLPVLTTAKHFPGHGDTATDSHLSLPVMHHSPERLAQVELPPFQAAIAAGVDTVMSAHIRLPAWDESAPATLSHRALGQCLRQDLGFAGLIVTDALVMAGVANWGTPAEVAVAAVAAGADILLMPADPGAAIEAVAQAVEQGRLSAAQISDSVERIYAAKQKINNLHASPPLDALAMVSTPAAQQVVRESLHASNRLPSTTLAVQPRMQARNIVVVPDVWRCEGLGHHTPAIARPAALGYSLQLLSYEQFQAIALPPGAHLLQLFIRGNPFRGQASLGDIVQQQVKELLKQEVLGAIVLYGSPYGHDWLQQYCPPGLPWCFSYGQMPAAQVIVMDALLPAQLPDAPSSDAGFI